MLRIDPTDRSLQPLGKRTLETARLLESYSLEELIRSNPRVVLTELGLNLLLLQQPVQLDGLQAVIAADPAGRLFIVGLQRKGVRFDLIAPLEAAGKLAALSGAKLLRRLSVDDRQELQDYLGPNLRRLNTEQGVLLVGETFDAETLAGAGWLKHRYGIRIFAYRAVMAVDAATEREYLGFRDVSPDIDTAYNHQQGANEAVPWPLLAPDDGGAKQTAEPAPTPAEPEAEPEPERQAEAEPQPLEATAEEVQGAAEEPAEVSEGPTAVVAAEPEERRDSGRRRDLQARRLRLDYFGRLLGARLVDFSKKGIGVEALSPLPVGAEVGISGELIGLEGAIGLEGRVKVKHCQSGEDGVCRIGLEFDAGLLREIDGIESFDRR